MIFVPHIFFLCGLWLLVPLLLRCCCCSCDLFFGHIKHTHEQNTTKFTFLLSLAPINVPCTEFIRFTFMILWEKESGMHLFCTGMLFSIGFGSFQYESHYLSCLHSTPPLFALLFIYGLCSRSCVFNVRNELLPFLVGARPFATDLASLSSVCEPLCTEATKNTFGLSTFFSPYTFLFICQCVYSENALFSFRCCENVCPTMSYHSLCT